MMIPKKFRKGDRYLALLMSAVFATATSIPISAQPKTPTPAQSPTTASPNPSGTQQPRQAFGGQLAVFVGHEEGIQNVVFSPDGTQILTTSQDKTARLWDRQGNLLVVFRGHKSWVQSAEFSPDGQRILTTSDDKTARLWDRQGNLLAMFGGSEHKVSSATFSPDGRQILTTSAISTTNENNIFTLNKDNTAQLWDSRGNLLAVFRGHKEGVRSAVFSPDGKQILTASNDKTARLWDRQGNSLSVLQGHEDTVGSAVFSPDGRQILTAGDQTARLWDRQGNLLTVLRHEDDVSSAVFSPDGRQILTDSNANGRLWDRQGNLLVVLRREPGLTTARFSPDGRYILTTNSDSIERAQLWDRQGNLLATLDETGNLAVLTEKPLGLLSFSATFSLDGQQILIASGKIARLWNVSDMIAAQSEQVAVLQAFQKDVAKKTAQLAVCQGHKNEVRSAIFSPDGRQILTTSYDQTTRLWDRQGNLLTVLEGGDSLLGRSGAAFSPDSQNILTTSNDKTARLWDFQGNLLTVFQGHESAVASVKFSPNGQYVVTESYGSIARLWDLHGNLLTVLPESRGRGLEFSPDSQQILIISSDRTVQVLDIQGHILTVLRGHEDSIGSAVFSPNGRQILTAGKDNTAQLWDSQGKLLTIFQGHKGWFFSAVFSPDGQQILTTSRDNTVRLWDRQGNLLATLQTGDQDLTQAAKFSPNGRQILTTGRDGTAQLWDLQGNLLAVLRGHEVSINSAEFSPDGRYVVTSSFDRTARLWDVSTAIALQSEQIAALRTSQATVSDKNAPQAEAALQAALQLNQQDTVEARQQALQKLEEALNRYRADNNTAKASQTLLLIGNINANLGQFQTAIDSYNQALPLSRQAGAKAEEAAILNSLGQLYNNLAAPKTALDYHNQALPLLYQLNDKGSAANTFNNIGDIQAATGEWKNALDSYNKALIISRPGGDLTAEATALTGIGSTYIASKKWSTALNAYNQSLIIARYLKDKIKETTILNQMGKIHAALGQNSIASDRYNQALALAQQLSYKTEEANIHYNQAILKRQQNNLTAAKTDIETAINIIESLRTQIASQALRQSYFARNQDYYKFYIDLLMQLHQKNPSQGYNALALHISERARARILLEQLTEASLDLKADLDPAIAAEEQRLTRSLNTAEQKRLNLLNSSFDNADLKAAIAEIDDILKQIQRLEVQIRRANPAYANLKYPDPLTLPEIQNKILDDKTLLLQYALGEERSYLFLASKTDLKTYQLPPKAEIEAAVEKYRTLLLSPDFKDLSQGQQLSQMLLGQVAGELKGQRLAIVGDGKMQLLPFAALPWGSGANLAPLLKNHEIITLPSATSLAVQREQWQKRQPAPKTLAVIADPIFKDNDPRLGNNATTVSAGDLSQYEKLIRNSCGDFDRLPYTATEAEQILALVPDAQEFSALGFDANYATATNPNLSQYRIVHLATHGCIQDNPLLSNLALSFFNANGQKAETSLLKLQDIYRLKLNADLVVLSACQTGTGKEVQGEGIVGLTRGFMYAGARRVAVSLWSVNDRATSILMSDYYRKMLEQKVDPAAALRQAQLAMWQSDSYSAPYYWAAFTLQGDW